MTTYNRSTYAAPLCDGGFARVGDIVRLVDIGNPADGRLGWGPDDFPAGVLGRYFRVTGAYISREYGDFKPPCLRVRPLTREEQVKEGDLPTSDKLPGIGFGSRRFSSYEPTNRVMKFMGRGASGLGLE